MPEPTGRQGHIDAALTNVSIAYGNGPYINGGIFPRLKVTKQSDKYFTFGKSAWYRDETGVRAPGAEAPMADYTIGTDSYLCLEKAVAKKVTDEEIDNSDAPLQPMITATKFVTDQIEKSVEIDVIGLVFGTGWSSSATPGTLWSNDASVPLDDIETAMNTVAQLIGREPNVGVIGRGLWRYLKNHPDIVDRIKYTGSSGAPAKVGLDAIAGLVGLEKILLTTALQDTGVEGAAASLAYIGGAHMWIGYVTPSPALAEPSAGYVFSLYDRKIERFRKDTAHTWIVEARQSWDAKVTAADSGYLIKSAA